ncbi:MAG TPA: S46 family peptidase, partial [Flavobacteriales bacterium]|nr:S46 family peptidase [Flavobacteriales bacterium]
MLKRTLSIAALLFAAVVNAQEGMWLLDAIKKVNESDMQSMGCKLTAEQIYDVNNSSMKDGVVRLGGGFCSGEMVSSDGLFLTNHHCGYDAIQSIYEAEHVYLTDGFWAMTREQGAPAEFYVSFLQLIENVTDRVLGKVNDDMPEAERRAAIRKYGQELEKEFETDKNISADFKSMYDGNEYYIYIYKDYHDVRLVGAPPSSLGKFGGDTDNWMWPRHTCDFSMFRVYTAPNGDPAEFSKENVPFKPKWWFPISLSGVEQDDFSMVMGCPGRTNRFLCSDGVNMELTISQPSVVKIRTELLSLMKQDMDASAAVRIKYASKYASIANYWKYFIGQQRGLKRLHVYDKKVAIEGDLSKWIASDPERQKKYGQYRDLLRQGYAERSKYQKGATYMNEAAFGSEAMDMSFNLVGLKAALEAKPVDQAAVDKAVADVREAMPGFYKDYNAATDQKITAAMFRLIHTDVEADLQPTVMAEIEKKFKGDYDAWAAELFKTSLVTDSTKLSAFLRKPSLKVLQKDMALHTMESCVDMARNGISAKIQAAQPNIDKGYRLMLAAMREREPNRKWYPNANSTIRLSYGKVGDYKPGDAMHYDYVTTADGI